MRKLLTLILLLCTVTLFAEMRGGAQYDPGAARSSLSNVDATATPSMTSITLSGKVKAAWADILGDIYASGTVKVTTGTAAAPAYSFASDPNTGVYSPGADSIYLSLGGNNRIQFDYNNNVSFFSGAVGGNPEILKLKHPGNAAVDRGPALSFYTPDNTGNASLSAQIIAAGEGGTPALNVGLRFNRLSGGTIAEALRVNSAGEMLIATSTDAGNYKLQVNGIVYVNGGVSCDGSVSYTGASSVAGTKVEYFIAAGQSKTLSEAIGVTKRARLEITSSINYYGMADYWIADDLTVTLITQQGSHFAATDAATSICVFNNAGTINIKNNKASAIYLTITYSGLKE